jgi:hypothetical protein
MAKDRSHLSVVRTTEEDHAAKTQALQQISARVPSRMQRVYDWSSDQAEALFVSMNRCVMEGMMPLEIEDLLDMPGLRVAYMDWLGRQ